MRVVIKSSKVGGALKAPQSKSYAIRLIFSSLLTNVELYNLTRCGDVVDAINAVSVFGVRAEGQRFKPPEKLALHKDYVYIDASATVLRMFIPVAAVIGGKILIDGGSSLRRRPIRAVVEALSEKGVRFSRDSIPTVMEGRLKDNYIEIYGGESSQYISGFMIAFSIVGGGTIKVRPPVASKSYIYLTAEVLKTLGVNVDVYENRVEVDVSDRLNSYRGEVPGDYLLASFYVAAALLTGGSIKVYGLPKPGEYFGMHSIVDIYRDMGAYSIYSNGVWYAEASENYKAIKVDIDQDPDIAPSIAALASIAQGETVLENVSRLAIKESNRVETIINTLKSFSIKAEFDGSNIHIYGGEPQRGCSSCFNDHRIGMMFASIAVRCGGELEGAECVNKSNPSFWRDLKFLGAKIEVV